MLVAGIIFYLMGIAIIFIWNSLDFTRGNDLSAVFFLVGFTWLVATLQIIGYVKKQTKLKRDQQFAEKIQAEWDKVTAGISLDHAVQVTSRLREYSMKNPFTLWALVEGDEFILVPTKTNSVAAYRELKLEHVPVDRFPLNTIRYYLQSGERVPSVYSTGGNTYSPFTKTNSINDPVRVHTQIIDYRHTRLYFDDNNQSEGLLTFDYDDFHDFKKIMPTKDYAICQENLTHPMPDSEESNNKAKEPSDNKESSSGNDSSAEKLRLLKQLYDENLLSTSEYLKKKAEILDEI